VEYHVPRRNGDRVASSSNPAHLSLASGLRGGNPISTRENSLWVIQWRPLGLAKFSVLTLIVSDNEGMGGQPDGEKSHRRNELGQTSRAANVEINAIERKIFFSCFVATATSAHQVRQTASSAFIKTAGHTKETGNSSTNVAALRVPIVSRGRRGKGHHLAERSRLQPKQ